MGVVSTVAYRIGIVSDWFYPKIGGIQSHVDGLCRYLLKQKYYPIVIAQKNKKECKNNFPYPVYRVDGFVLPFFDFAPVGTYGHLQRVISYGLFDLIHSHHAFTPMSLYSIDIAYKYGIPSVLTAHSLGFWWRSRYIWKLFSEFLMGVRQYYKKVNRIIAVSNAVKDFMSYFANPEKIVVIPNAIHTSEYRLNVDKQDLRNELNIAPDEKVILFLGRLVFRKGVHILIDAFKKLNADPLTRLYIIGTGSMEATLRGMVSAFNLSNRVVFVGRVSHELKIKYLNAADFVVAPSIYGEAFGIVVIEALAAGKPVIATRVGGMKDILHHGEDGFFVPAADSNTLKDTMELLLKDEDLLKKMSKNALETAKRYDWEVVGKEILDLYNSLLMHNGHTIK